MDLGSGLVGLATVGLIGPVLIVLESLGFLVAEPL